MNRRERKLFHIMMWILFAIYILALCYFLFFAEHLGRDNTDSFHYNFIPLKEIRRYVTYYKTIGTARVMLNLGGNVVAFLPMGFFLSMLFGGQGKRALSGFSVTMISMEISIMVEILQLFTKVGSCDIDDVILNTLGGLLGYLIFCTMRRIRSKRNESKKTKKI